MTTTRRVVALALVGSAVAMAGSRAIGQGKGDLLKGVTFEESKKEIQKGKQVVPVVPSEQSNSSLGLPFSCDGFADKDKGLYAACLSALEETFTYESERLKHRKWVFRCQLIATNVSFVIVMVMIGLGLWFAYIQFSREFPIVPGKTTVSDSVAADQVIARSQTDIEVSLARIKVSSSILGVIILGLAMGFFYLYIRFVFPILSVQ